MAARVTVGVQRWGKTCYDGIEIYVLRRDAETGGGWRAVLKRGVKAEVKWRRGEDGA